MYFFYVDLKISVDTISSFSYFILYMSCFFYRDTVPMHFRSWAGKLPTQEKNVFLLSKMLPQKRIMNFFWLLLVTMFDEGKNLNFRNLK